MKYIKTFESIRLVGKLFRIYPTRDSKEMIVIAKLIEITGGNKNWGEYSGYILYPESAKGKEWSGSEFLTDWSFEIPTVEEVKFYKYCESLKKFNI